MSNVFAWSTKRLDEVGEIISGATPSTTNELFWDGEIVWVTPSDLSRLNTPYLYESAKKITEKGLQGCSAQLLPAGSVVISSRAPIGYVAIPKVDFCTNQGCKSIKLKAEYDSEFTYYNIGFHVEKLKNVGEGTTFAEISKAALSKIEIPFPKDKGEQTQIAAILSTLDKAIEQTEALIAKQQRIKTGLMQDLLTQGIDEHGNIRSEATHEFKDSPLGRIPVEWEFTRTGEVCELSTKGATPKVRGLEGGQFSIPFLRVQNLTFDGGLNFSGLEFIEPEIHAGELRRSTVLPGDVLQNIVGPPLGKISIVPSAYPEWNVNQAIAIFRPGSKVSSEYLCKWLSTPFARTWFDLNSKKTSGQQNLTLEHCHDLPLALPSMDEQLRIFRVIGVFERVEQQNQSGLLLLRRLKAGLMHDLLTGKVRVTELLEPETPTPEAL